MDEKQADNKIINSKQYERRREIAEIENKINSHTQNLKQLRQNQETYNEINKRLNHCIELLSNSIKGNKTELLLDSMRTENIYRIKKINEDIDNDKNIEIKYINSLSENKKKLIKEYNEEENKEE